MDNRWGMEGYFTFCFILFRSAIVWYFVRQHSKYWKKLTTKLASVRSISILVLVYITEFTSSYIDKKKNAPHFQDWKCSIVHKYPYLHNFEKSYNGSKSYKCTNFCEAYYVERLIFNRMLLCHRKHTSNLYTDWREHFVVHLFIWQHGCLTET